MELAARSVGLLVAALPLAGTIGTAQVKAQSIVPAADGTNTIVTPTGNSLDITGGQRSGDGTNLFHSFLQFGVQPGQTANFVSAPEIQNILGRVTGGDASVINGIIQVTKGNANLYLMNPAGIVFGAGASLNVPAAFTATTANGIGIGSEWFNAVGANDYATLNGTPSAFTFKTNQPGAIVNEGSLVVGEGKNLNLVGGTVVNTGKLASGGGNISVAAVPGESVVRISQEGHLLSLEISPNPPYQGGNEGGSLLPTAKSLPSLLTGGSVDDVTSMKVNSNGQVELTGSGVAIPSSAGTAIASGTIDTSGKTGGTVQVLGDKVGLVGANINASGIGGGGKVMIGGDYQGKSSFNASQTYVDKNSTIAADAQITGNGGQIVVWADKSTTFRGNISAKGGSSSGNGGFAEVSGKINLDFTGKADLSATKGTSGTLLLDPANIIIVDGPSAPDDAELADGQILAGDNPGGTFTISEGALESLAASASVILEATNDITIADLTSDGYLTFAADPFGPPGAGITFKADSDSDGVGSFSMNPLNTIFADGRNVTISGASVSVGNINTYSAFNNGGNISLTATNGNIATNNNLTSGSNIGNAGTITLNATNGNIAASSYIDSTAGGNGGAVILNAPNGNVQVNAINTSTTGGTGGAVDITAGGLVQVTDGILFDPQGASILTSGDPTTPASGGAVTIRHGGGLTGTPFIVGDATTNGTKGNIISGDATTPSYVIYTTFPVPTPTPSPSPSPDPTSSPSPSPTASPSPVVSDPFVQANITIGSSTPLASPPPTPPPLPQAIPAAGPVVDPGVVPTPVPTPAPTPAPTPVPSPSADPSLNSEQGRIISQDLQRENQGSPAISKENSARSREEILCAAEDLYDLKEENPVLEQESRDATNRISANRLPRCCPKVDSLQEIPNLDKLDPRCREELERRSVPSKPEKPAQEVNSK